MLCLRLPPSLPCPAPPTLAVPTTLLQAAASAPANDVPQYASVNKSKSVKGRPMGRSSIANASEAHGFDASDLVGEVW